MSWGSHLAEGERNGRKASTQVGHGSRWDTDCSVVYSCWGLSTLLYRGQKLSVCYISPHNCWHTKGRHLIVILRDKKKSCSWNFCGRSLWSFQTHYFLKSAHIYLWCFQKMLENKKDRSRWGRKSHATQRSQTIVNISLCLHWITLYGFTRNAASSGTFHQGSDQSLYSKQ